MMKQGLRRIGTPGDPLRVKQHHWKTRAEENY